MNIYLSKEVKITKIVSHDEKKVETLTLIQKPKHNFFGFKFGDIITFYKSTYNKYKTLNDAQNGWGSYYKIIPTNDVNVYNIVKKPYVNISLSNGESYEKIFEDINEMSNYLKNLPLNNLYNILPQI